MDAEKAYFFPAAIRFYEAGIPGRRFKKPGTGEVSGKLMET
jgi:hypothetical protein